MASHRPRGAEQPSRTSAGADLAGWPAPPVPRGKTGRRLDQRSSLRSVARLRQLPSHVGEDVNRLHKSRQSQRRLLEDDRAGARWNVRPGGHWLRDHGFDLQYRLGPPVRSALLVGSLLPLWGCSAGWHRIDPAESSRLPDGQQVQVWQGARRLQLHALHVDSGWVSGVPFQQPRDCDSCRITLPSATVDSLRAGNPTAAFLKSIGLTLGTWFTLGLLTYRLGGD